jgi:hypothetical protein
MTMRMPATLFASAAMAFMASAPVIAADPSAIESDLTITVQGGEKHVTLGEALALLKVPSV